MSPEWTNAFRVVEVLENGAYRLETLEGGAIPRTWNGANLILFQLRCFADVFFMNNVVTKGTLFFLYEGFLTRSPNGNLFLKEDALELFVC